MKFFPWILDASVQEALNFLPFGILLTEEELVGPGEIFNEIFVNRDDSHKMLFCL